LPAQRLFWARAIRFRVAALKDRRFFGAVTASVVFVADIHAGGLPRRRPPPAARRSTARIASAIWCCSERSSASILRMSMVIQSISHRTCETQSRCFTAGHYRLGPPKVRRKLPPTGRLTGRFSNRPCDGRLPQSNQLVPPPAHRRLPCYRRPREFSRSLALGGFAFVPLGPNPR
jgi:hypothetical protein